jgi:hypothetical protein
MSCNGCVIEYCTGEIHTIADSNAVLKHCVECDNCLAAPAFILSVIEIIDQQCVFYEDHCQRRVGGSSDWTVLQRRQMLAAVATKERYIFVFLGFVSQELLGWVKLRMLFLRVIRLSDMLMTRSTAKCWLGMIVIFCYVCNVATGSPSFVYRAVVYVLNGC